MDNFEKQYEGSAAKRIMDAIMGAIVPHPLSKKECKECQLWVTEKDMPKHMSEHIELYEMVGQSERESWEIAHS